MLRKKSMDELERLPMQLALSSTRLPYCLVLDDVRSMLNVGSVFRTADCFMAASVHLSGITGRPPHREIEKTALGATMSVPWVGHSSITEALTTLKHEGYTLVVIEQVHGGGMLHQFVPDTTKKYALILGNEVEGVSEAALSMADMGIEIPQWGSKHSLNISVAAGVVAWHFAAGLSG